MYKYKRINLLNGKFRDRHRLIMEKHLGRKLTFNEVVDHINGNSSDDRLENLRLMTRSEHTRMHMKDFMKTPEGKIRIKKLIEATKKLRLPHTTDKYTCCSCKKLKNKNKFWVNKFKWNGLSAYCIECQKCLRKGWKSQVKR